MDSEQPKAGIFAYRQRMNDLMKNFRAETPNDFRLPRRIRRLGQMVYNLWWTWNPDAQRLFVHIDRDLWERTQHNPVRFLRQVKRAKLNAVTQDRYYLKTRPYGLRILF